MDKAIQKANNAYERGKIILDMVNHDEAGTKPSPYAGIGTRAVSEGEDVSFYWHGEEDKKSLIFRILSEKWRM